MISIHSLVKRETYAGRRAAGGRNRNFNPLPRKEGDDAMRFAQYAGTTDFNPLPRKEGDICVGNQLEPE